MDRVIEKYDVDPNSLKPEQPQQDQNEQRLQMIVEMAGMENKQMISGKVVPPTPYAPPVHTRIHVEFMQSPAFQQLPNDSPVIKIMTDHVMGELFAQEARGQQGQPDQSGAQPNQGTTATSVSQGMQNRPGGMAQGANSMQNIMPNRNMGQNGALNG
jgi:hypothetical protein